MKVLPMRWHMVTFGSAHVEAHAASWPELRLDGYVAIWARTESEARAIAHAYFGPAWAFLYCEGDHSPEEMANWYGAGAVMTINAPYRLEWRFDSAGRVCVAHFEDKVTMNLTAGTLVARGDVTILSTQGPTVR